MSEDSRITCVGDLMWVIERPPVDLPPTNRTCVVRGDEATWGGSAWNVAQHLVSLGQPAEFVALVGAMDRAAALRQLILKNIEASGLIPYDGPTNTLIAFVGKKSARSIFVCGKNTLPRTKLLADRLVEKPVLVFSGSRDKLVRAVMLERIEKGSCSFVFSPSYSVFTHKPNELRRFSKRADVAIFNEAEFRFFSDAMGGRRRAIDSQRCCVVTRAHRGATVYFGHRAKRFPSSGGSKDDVIGAGDAFLAGFLVSWLKYRDPVVAGQAGADFSGNFVRASKRRSKEKNMSLDEPLHNSEFSSHAS